MSGVVLSILSLVLLNSSLPVDVILTPPYKHEVVLKKKQKPVVRPVRIPTIIPTYTLPTEIPPTKVLPTTVVPTTIPPTNSPEPTGIVVQPTIPFMPDPTITLVPEPTRYDPPPCDWEWKKKPGFERPMGDFEDMPELIMPCLHEMQ